VTVTIPYLAPLRQPEAAVLARLVVLHQQRQVETAALAVVVVWLAHLVRAVRATRLLYRLAKVAMAAIMLRQRLITVVAVVAVLLLSAQMEHLERVAAMAVLVQRHLFPVVPLHTQVVAAVPHTKQEQVALVAQAAVVQQVKRRERQLLELPTREAAAVAGIKTQTRLAQQAAPASSFSSTPYPFSLS
jgi:hypothetical protein